MFSPLAVLLFSFIYSTLSFSNPQANEIQQAGITLSSGSYTFQNVATGEKLNYVPNGNHIFPSSPGTPIRIDTKTGWKGNWLRLSLGSNKNKCLSAAFGAHTDVSATAYECAVGPGAKQGGTLELTKQWWLAVPVSSQQKRSLDVGIKRLAKREIDKVLEKRRRRKHHRHHHGKGKGKGKGTGAGKGKNGGGSSSGTFYIIPVYHLSDTATQALTGETIVARGIKSTQLSPLQKGNRAQQWRIIAH